MRSKLMSFGLLMCFLFFGSMIAEADHVNVPAAAFQSSNDTSLVVYLNYLGGVYMSGLSGYLVAPVYLPDGALIKSIRVVFYDNEGSSNIKVHLVRQNVYLDDHNHLYSISSSGASTSLQAVSDSTILGPASYTLVQNGPVQYYIEADFGSASINLRLHHVAIAYQ